VLRAVQAGNDVYAPASLELPVTIGRAQQTLSWPTLPNPTFGDPAFDAVVTSSSGLPVTLGVAAGRATVNSATVTLVGAGAITLSATQAGDANREPVTETRSFTVAKADQTLIFPTLADRRFTAEPFSLPGVASSRLALEFRIVSGPARTVENRVQLTGLGTVVVRAEQPGNADWNAAPPVERSFVVAIQTQTLAFAPVGPLTYGDLEVTLSAVSSAGLKPVVFRAVSGPATLSGDRLRVEGAGTVVVRADQAGDERYEPAMAELTIEVAKAGQSVSFAAIPDRAYSTNEVMLRATTTSGLPAGFRVVSGPAKVAADRLTLTGVGTVAVAAEQTGDANYLAATPVTNRFTVIRGFQTISFATLGDQVLGQAPLTLEASSTAGLPIAFTVVSGPASVSGSQLTLLGEGTVTVRAWQPGSPLYQGAQADQTFTVRDPATPLPARLEAAASGATPEGFKLVFQGEPGGRYVVEATGQVQGAWSDASPVLTSPTGRFEYLDAGAPPARFYRVRWVAP
jgi:hypothetical protein